MTRRSLALRLRRMRNDEGVTLVEVVVSLLILSVTFIALNVTILSGLHASVIARQNQQGADAATQAIELVRDQSYAGVAMRSTDLAGDSAITSCSGTYCFNPGTGSEPLVLDAAGSVYPHATTLPAADHNGQTFSVKTYITQPTDTSVGASYKRVTAVVTWTVYGKTHTRKESSIITDTRRGLPLPRYNLSISPAAQSLAPLATATYKLTLNNLGARDSFNLSYSPTTPVWTFYADSNGDGNLTIGTDTLLSDTNGDGIVDTGLIEPNAKLVIFASRVIGASETGVLATTFTTTSVAQPTASGAAQSQTGTTTIVGAGASATGTATATPSPTASSGTGSCPSQDTLPTYSGLAGSTATTFHMQNAVAAPTADTTAQTTMALRSAISTSSTLYNYSTDIATSPAKGRTVTSTKSAYWDYINGGSTHTYGGTAVLSVWAEPTFGASNSPGAFTVTVQPFDNKNVALGSAQSASYSTAEWGCNQWRLIQVGVPVSTVTLKNNYYLRFTISVASGMTMSFAYQTTSYDSTLQIGQA